MHWFESHLRQFCLFSYLFSLQTDAFKQLKYIGQNNIEVSFTHYSSGYILQQTVNSISTTNQCSKYHKIGLTNSFLLRMCGLLVKRTKSNFSYTLNHSVVSKTTLVCTAVYNAITHSKWFIQINLDQSATKQATAI